MTGASQPPLDASTFRLLQGLIHQRFGLFYQEDQRDLLALKLLPRLQALGLNNYLDYYYLLKYAPQAAEEWTALAETLTVNETYFWREFDQIEVTAQVLVPQWQKQAPGNPIRLWHAGCASGEEPYTMAIALTERGAFDRGPIEIIGTDLNAAALEKAFRGVYRTRALRAVPPEIREKYFRPLGDNLWELDPAIRRRVRFFRLNLLDEEAPRPRHPFHAIFCRNVFIYFSAEAVRKVSERFYHLLRDDGVLFLGAAESLLPVTTRFTLIEIEGALGYRKVLEETP